MPNLWKQFGRLFNVADTDGLEHMHIVVETSLPNIVVYTILS